MNFDPHITYNKILARVVIDKETRAFVDKYWSISNHYFLYTIECEEVFVDYFLCEYERANVADTTY